MRNYKTIITGVEPDGEVNEIELYKCGKCDEWKREVYEDGKEYICEQCQEEYVKCSVCEKYDSIEGYLSLETINNIDVRILEWNNIKINEYIFVCNECSIKENK